MPNDSRNIAKVLLDVNVCLDLIVNRSIPQHIKKKLFSIFLKYEITPFVPAFSIDTIFYILNNSLKVDKEIAKYSILELLNYTKLLHTSDKIVHKAFASGFPDFEDGLVNAVAEFNDVGAIITSNIADFKKSTLSVYKPADFVALFQE